MNGSLNKKDFINQQALTHRVGGIPAYTWNLLRNPFLTHEDRVAAGRLARHLVATGMDYPTVRDEAGHYAVAWALLVPNDTVWYPEDWSSSSRERKGWGFYVARAMRAVYRELEKIDER